MKKVLTVVKNLWKLFSLLFLTVITFSYAMFQGGFVSWFLFYSFLPFAIYGIALSIYPFKIQSVERVFLKTDYNAGEKLLVAVKLRRFSSFPLFYMLMDDQLSEPLSFCKQKKRSKSLLFPHFQKEVLFDYELEELPRGEHVFNGVTVKIGDPLGLVEKQRTIPSNDKIIVYPAYEELIYRPLENHYDQGMTASKERVQRDTTMAIGLREYQPGDRFSWINWKATAKRNDIMTKEFEQRQSHDVLIIMDCAPEKRFEAVVSFTASITRAILRKGAQVGLLSSSAERASFQIRSGEAHQQQIFYHLAKVKDQSTVTLDKVIQAENFLAQQNTSLMLITSQLTKALIEKASFFASRKGSVTIFTIKNEKESPTQNEISLRASANARGVRVVFVHDGHFSDAFSEVNRG
ncbi:DUF58 domain-containing protein [Cytobacillus sp. FJAT-54145]|uniref:DUF58 domain-containing protein n=1 Tax=Cytobacillus spartinae TaxID=3299023 RepID=A0ABW6KIJ3_9BACI